MLSIKAIGNVEYYLELAREDVLHPAIAQERRSIEVAAELAAVAERRQKRMTRSPGECRVAASAPLPHMTSAGTVVRRSYLRTRLARII